MATRCVTRRWVLGVALTAALLFTVSIAGCRPITGANSNLGGAGAAQAAAVDETEVNKAAVRGWFDAINSQDINVLERAVDKYYAPDYVLHDPTVPNFSGGAGTIKRLVRESMAALPDAHLTIEDMIAEGDSVAIRVSVSGTQPDGTPLKFWTMSMIRFVDGQWAEEWQLAEAAGEEVVGSDIGQQ